MKEAFYGYVRQRMSGQSQLISSKEDQIRYKYVGDTMEIDICYKEILTNALRTLRDDAIVVSETIYSDTGIFSKTYRCLIPIEEEKQVDVHLTTISSNKVRSEIKVHKRIFGPGLSAKERQKQRIPMPSEELEVLKRRLKEEVLQQKEYRLLHATGLIH